MGGVKDMIEHVLLDGYLTLVYLHFDTIVVDKIAGLVCIARAEKSAEPPASFPAALFVAALSAATSNPSHQLLEGR